ncbi:MAG: alpha/beta hydrolase-fold protein [Deltaproteobacteria bacterium]|nr:alpha/beta hydrolase-fold protein [Deltaproteobacteria bacterium]
MIRPRSALLALVALTAHCAPRPALFSDASAMDALDAQAPDASAPDAQAPEASAPDASAPDAMSGDPCVGIATRASDDEALSDAIACVSRAGTSAAVAAAAIAEMVTVVEGRGGFPVLGASGVRFVYVRDARWDAEDDARSSSEDFAAARRNEPITVAGEFNAWNPTSMPMQHHGHGLFVASLAMRPSDAMRWGYKFVARDPATSPVWFSDPLSRRFQYDTNGRISFVRGDTRAGHLEWIRSVRATQLANERRIYLYVPPGYDQRETVRYPTLYMHDGNNAFDTAQPFSAPATWDVDATSDTEILAGNSRPFVIIAVPNNGDRMDEYTHTMDTLSGRRLGGRGAQYLDFIVRDLKPEIDRRYRTRTGREDTAMVGSSLGGLITFYAGILHPDVFSAVAGMSSTFGWGSFGGGTDTMIARYRAAGSLAMRNQRFYLDSGGGPAGDGSCTFGGMSEPRDNFCETRDMRTTLVAAGVTTFALDPSATMIQPANTNIVHWYEADAPHNEAAWRVRMFRVLRFFFRP